MPLYVFPLGIQPRYDLPDLWGWQGKGLLSSLNRFFCEKFMKRSGAALKKAKRSEVVGVRRWLNAFSFTEYEHLLCLSGSHFILLTF
jgi:hypothetical protein